jgi:hypothetical protein
MEGLLPDMVAPYIDTSRWGWASTSSPGAVALELIAKELRIPPEKFFKMFVDYANVGVTNESAREEVAEAIYKGTHGQLTLGELETLPYPTTTEASLAPLLAVEDALDIPDRDRYSKISL